MAWTQDEYDALETAYKSGHLSVQYRDRSVTYVSSEEMKRRLTEAARELGISSVRSFDDRARKASTKKGI